VVNLVSALHDLMQQAAVPQRKTYGLTPRELEVVGCIVEGCSNRDIAKQFTLSEETVKRHLSNIFDKTGVSTRLELALFAIAHHLVAFRDLIRDRLVTEQTAAPDATVVGTVTLIYDHHSHGVSEKLTEVQHQNHDLVVSTSHAHLDHESCLEVLIVHGKSARVEQFADRLIGLKGVQHGRLVMTVPAHQIEPAHSHTHDQSHKHNHKH
jgi:nickel-responsive transcriptional regulator NikR